MASTFTLKTDAVEGRHLQVYLSQAKDIAGNFSTVNYVISSLGGEVNYYNTGPTTVTIGGVQVYYKELVRWDSKQFPAAKGSVTGSIQIPHDTEGNKTIEVVISTAIYYSAVKTYRGTWTLDSIPRGAKIVSVSDFNDTERPTVTYSNPAGNNAKSLDLCIADLRGYAYAAYRAIPKTGTLQYTFTDEDVNILKKRAGNELKVRFYIRTVIGDATLYDYVDRTFTMTDNEDTKPVITSYSVSCDNTALPSAFADMYIQGKTRLNISIEAQGKYGANIDSYYAIVDDKTYNGKEITTDALTTSGEVRVRLYAKDSRGFVRTIATKEEVTAYEKPSVVPLDSENAILCYRSDGNGTSMANSTSVWIKAKRSHYNLAQKNRCALEWRRKLSTEAWDDSTHLWQNLIPSDTTTSKEYNALLANAVFDVTKSYTIQIRAIDDVGEFGSKPFDVPTQDVALHLGKGGKNVSIGTYCDYSREHTFYSDWLAIFDKGIEGTLNNAWIRDVISFAEGCPVGLTPFVTDSATTNIPLNGHYAYSTGIVHKRNASQINIYLTNYQTGAIAINVCLDGAWTGWKYLTPQ